MSASQRRKGHDWEREVARRLCAIFPGARRGIQTRDGGGEAADVVIPAFHIECKAGATISLPAAMRQAVADAGPGRWPTVISKRDREVPMVTMRLEDWLELVEQWAVETRTGRE